MFVFFVVGHFVHCCVYLCVVNRIDIVSFFCICNEFGYLFIVLRMVVYFAGLVVKPSLLLYCFVRDAVFAVLFSFCRVFSFVWYSYRFMVEKVVCARDLGFLPLCVCLSLSFFVGIWGMFSRLG